MKLVRFTAPDGSPALINPDQVENVKPAGDIYGPRARTVIMLANGFQAVRESETEVAEKLGAT